jgi:hypothetical protein
LPTGGTNRHAVGKSGNAKSYADVTITGIVRYQSGRSGEAKNGFGRKKTPAMLKSMTGEEKSLQNFFS